MDIKKILSGLFFLASSIITIFFFWNEITIPLSILAILIILKHKFLPIKRETTWFLFTSFFGALGEILIIFGGAWYYYPKAQFLNIPIWLPLLWGLTATTLITLYEGISSKKKEQ